MKSSFDYINSNIYYYCVNKKILCVNLFDENVDYSNRYLNYYHIPNYSLTQTILLCLHTHT